jgi:hypothetical protein
VSLQRRSVIRQLSYFAACPRILRTSAVIFWRRSIVSAERKPCLATALAPWLPWMGASVHPASAVRHSRSGYIGSSGSTLLTRTSARFTSRIAELTAIP